VKLLHQLNKNRNSRRIRISREIVTEPALGIREVKNIVTDLLKALLGDGSVNTFQNTRQATIRWKYFLCVRAWTIAVTSHNSE
jgi:RNase P/RNase MRP subunit POP5